jgi:hypothetical protein
MIAARLRPLSFLGTVVLSAFLVVHAGSEAAVKSGGFPGSAIGPTVTIDNGVTGDGRMEVTLGAGGEDDIQYDPLGADGLGPLTFEVNHYVDVGAGGIQLGATTITQPPTVTGPNQVTSAGNFPGPNGVINWTAVSTIPPGTTLYTTTLSFSSASAFGPVRLVQYIDADVDDLASNNIVQIGDFGSPTFVLLTASSSRRLGVGHSGPLVSGATCPGWAASEFDELRSAIETSVASYSPFGNVFGLPPTQAPFFPGLPAWGPADMTSGIACDLNPGATSATIAFSTIVVESAAIPTLGQWGVIAMVGVLIAAAMWQLRRRRLYA